MTFDVNELRSRFPALRRGSTIYLDGPAGTQVPDSVIEAVAIGLATGASNVGGPFAASRRSDRIVAEARRAAADFVGGDPSEIVFGANMTSITMAFSRAVLAGLAPGDRIVLSRLDHDANVTSWTRAAEDYGIEVDWIDIDQMTTKLDLDSLEAALTPDTRLVAVTGCSNAFGTLTDLEAIVDLVSGHGIRVFVDAVHMAAHRRINVADLGVDALVCSAYKFFGPHVGVLWGKRDWLDQINPYKVRPSPADTPGKFETGTPSFGLLAGATAAIDHLASLGEGDDRRARLDDAYAKIGEHESALGNHFLDSLPKTVKVRGVRSMKDRVTTFAVSVEGHTPDEVAASLADTDINVWAGHYYAIEPMLRLGLLGSGGLVRIGFVNTTTVDEVDRLITELSKL